MHMSTSEFILSFEWLTTRRCDTTTLIGHRLMIECMFGSLHDLGAQIIVESTPEVPGHGQPFITQLFNCLNHILVLDILE